MLGGIIVCACARPSTQVIVVSIPPLALRLQEKGRFILGSEIALGSGTIDLVVTLYNSEAHVAQLVASIEMLDPSPARVILVDDCSSDATLERLNHALAASSVYDRAIIVCRQRNGGSSAARNTGLDESLNRYVAFLDGDDLPLRHRLAVPRESFGRWSLSFGPIAIFNDDRAQVVRVRGGRRHRSGDVLLRLSRSNFIPFSTVTIDRSVSTHRFRDDVRSSEDWLFVLEAARSGPVVSAPRPLVLYRQHPQSKSSDSGAKLAAGKAIAPLVSEFAGVAPSRLGDWRHRYNEWRAGQPLSRLVDRVLLRDLARAPLEFGPEICDLLISQLRSRKEHQVHLDRVRSRALELSR